MAATVFTVSTLIPGVPLISPRISTYDPAGLSEMNVLSHGVVPTRHPCINGTEKHTMHGTTPITVMHESGVYSGEVLSISMEPLKIVQVGPNNSSQLLRVCRHCDDKRSGAFLLRCLGSHK